MPAIGDNVGTDRGHGPLLRTVGSDAPRGNYSFGKLFLAKSLDDNRARS